MKKTQDIASAFFIGCVGVLTIVAILNIWEFLQGDLLAKSFKTIGLLGIVAVIVAIAARFIDSPNQAEADALTPPVVNPFFPATRRFTAILLIVSVSLLALFGILSIWEVLSRGVISKSLSSITILAFASFVIVLTCVSREKIQVFHRKLPEWLIFTLILISFWAAAMIIF